VFNLPGVHRSRAKCAHGPTRLCYCGFLQPLCSPLVLISGQGVLTMPIEMRPAIPAALPHAAVARGRWERLLGWLRAAVTVLAATVAVLGAAMTAVILGIT
jgi:hypothetical protein